MDKVTVPGPLTAQLDCLAKPVMIVDENGRKLGHFVPCRAMPLADDCPYSAEELERMRSQQGGRPLSEIWRSLGAR